MKITKTQVFIFTVVICFLWVADLRAATINAASCSAIDVQSAVNSASNGDTIVVPSGSCTWSVGIAVPKQISIIGSTSGCPSACNDGVIINASGGITAFYIQHIGVRISGFTFVGEGNGNGIINVHKTGGGISNWRIDHCHFKDIGQTTPGNRSINVGAYGDVYENIDKDFPGLIDNNYFSGVKQNKAIQMYGGSGTYNDWNDTLSLGGPSFLFIENNKFDFGSFTDGTGCFDTDSGGRSVFRYNDFGHCWLSYHGQEKTTDVILPWRSAHGWEIYNNHWTDTEYYWARVTIRGGTGVIWNNTFTIGHTADTTPIIFEYQRGDAAPPEGLCTSNLACNGTNTTYDRNEAGKRGYPCYQQVGMTGSNGITSFPAYEWSNIYNGAACTSCFWIWYNATCGYQHVQFSRDIIKNGTTPKPGYTPYTYPHPLTKAGITVPQKLRIAE